MRKAFSIILLLSLTFRPIVEFGTILYYELNIDYIIDKYCVNKERPWLKCDGKCYLMSQLKTDTTPETEETDGILIQYSFFPLYFQEYTITLADRRSSIIDKRNNWKISKDHFFEVILTIDHPPNSISTLL